MTTGKTIALTRWTFIGKVMFLLFNMLYRLVIAFLPRSKCLLISWLQSPSAVILEPKKIKSVTVSIVSPTICQDVMGLDAMILVFRTLSFNFVKRRKKTSATCSLFPPATWGPLGFLTRLIILSMLSQCPAPLITPRPRHAKNLGRGLKARKFRALICLKTKHPSLHLQKHTPAFHLCLQASLFRKIHDFWAGC